MTDKRSVDELSLQELEALVEQRRRIERARQFAQNDDRRRFRPVTVMQTEEPAPAKENRPSAQRKRKSLRDRILFAVEIIAVVGLLVIIVGSLTNLQTLNQEVAQAKAGTPNATTNAQDANSVELPGSSFPPSNPLLELPGSSFAPQNAPPALGIQLKSVAALPVPTPGPRSPTRIVIPSINLDWPVVQGDSWNELKQGVGHRVGTANPGERGNLVLSGHNDVYGEPFRDLEKLAVGSDVFVHAGNTSFRYVIKARRVVVPTDLSVLVSSKDPIVTLITCTPYRIDTHRLILIGELMP
ncbi:MAG: sortase [Chloroflexi bacterium]|nr:sortase [Chloroflexota bacterium]